MYTKPQRDARPGGHQSAPLPRTLVTGATSGIGYALAVQLAQAGVPVVALGRSQDRLQALQQRFPQIATVACDLADVAALPSLARQWVEQFPDLAVVIHNAGVQDNLRMDEVGYIAAQVRVEVDINLVAPMVLTQALLAHLQARPGATIVNITSGLAFAPKRTSAVYCATKAGLHLFSQALRLQLKGSGVRVVEAVMPLVDTPMTQGRGKGKLSAEQAARQVIEGLLGQQDTIWVGKARALPWLLRLAPGVLALAMARM
ncbi:MAG: SDR family NAD(P)-dependent oxidoreductase [Vitreoscilla sp.]|nr:SDR family NAD(P)-dependent oxidoreductase [Burkholderiales bacterium]MBP6337205.1 SDR family NAD(P)-dependent oxidoreductase [Vitreoscilla sp.]MBP6675408.1 SDR family NAD(P)-dependent oxidoreductase [Vitreoscilla sp.]